MAEKDDNLSLPKGIVGWVGLRVLIVLPVMHAFLFLFIASLFVVFGYY